jgi:pleuromutilin/lincosamide/streptogramin A transport system ATP-binding/permease protein
LAQLQFKGQDVHKLVSVLSGGERVKVSLAKLLAGDYNTLVLDEPTNFLDLQAVKALEELLRQYDGNIILVSHDRRFLDSIANKLLIIDGQKLIQFDGTYKEWMESPSDIGMSEIEEELLRIENELSIVLSKLSIEPSDSLDKRFQELLKRKQEIKVKLNEK